MLPPLYSPTNATAAKNRALSLLQFPNIDKFKREIPLPSILAYTRDLGPIYTNIHGKHVITDSESESYQLNNSSNLSDNNCNSNDDNNNNTINMTSNNYIDDDKSNDGQGGFTDSGDKLCTNIKIDNIDSNNSSSNDSNSNDNNSIRIMNMGDMTTVIKCDVKPSNEHSVQQPSESIAVLATTSISTSPAVSMTLSNADKTYVDDQCFSLPCCEIPSNKGEHPLIVNFHL